MEQKIMDALNWISANSGSVTFGQFSAFAVPSLTLAVQKSEAQRIEVTVPFSDTSLIPYSLLMAANVAQERLKG